MIRSMLAYCAVAVGATAFMAVQSVSAATIIQSGDTVDGWKISFPVGVGLSLVADNTSGLELGLEKFVDFSSSEGIAITFTQASTNGEANQIALLNESITNSTGSGFGGFQFLLISPLGGGQTFASTFSTGAISPWTTSDPAGGTSISLGGGTLASGDTAELGFGADGGDLVINANPVLSGMPANFVLKEIPLGGGGSSSVPLPAAAWPSLFGVAGAAIIAAVSKRRKLS